MSSVNIHAKIQPKQNPNFSISPPYHAAVTRMPISTAQKSRLPMKSTRYAAAFVLSINSYHLLYLNTMMSSPRKAVMQSMM